MIVFELETSGLTIDVPISDIRISIFDFYSMFDVVLRKLVLASSVLGALL